MGGFLDLAKLVSAEGATKKSAYEDLAYKLGTCLSGAGVALSTRWRDCSVFLFSGSPASATGADGVRASPPQARTCTPTSGAGICTSAI